jgi:Ca-activated chloride channel family protein
MSARSRIARALLIGALAMPLSAAALEVRVLEPSNGAPAFGEVQISAEVRGGAAQRLEIWLDGRRAGTLERPPWRTRIDVGQENVPRRLRVVAVGADGNRAHAEVVLAAIRVDESVELQLQQLYVTATGGGGPVLDLGREELRVFEEGRAQPLVTFERGDVPLTAVLLIDASTSMRGAPLATALEGARAFVAGMQPLDEAQLVLFSDQVLHRTPFTGDAAALAAGLDGVEARGGSAIADHLLLALLGLERRQGRRLVVLLSDGVDVESVLSTRELEPVVGRSTALLYWIRLRDEPEGARHRSLWRGFEEHAAELEGLARMVEASGGRTISLERIEDAPGAFRAILDELRRQYVLGWYPSGLRHDGSWREIRVEVARRGVEARSRAGYFDD